MTKCGSLIFGGMLFLGAGTGAADAQQWLLNSSASHFYMQTVKANSIFENHRGDILQSASMKARIAPVALRAPRLRAGPGPGCNSCSNRVPG